MIASDWVEPAACEGGQYEGYPADPHRSSPLFLTDTMHCSNRCPGYACSERSTLHVLREQLSHCWSFSWICLSRRFACVRSPGDSKNPGRSSPVAERHRQPKPVMSATSLIEHSSGADIALTHARLPLTNLPNNVLSPTINKEEWKVDSGNTAGRATGSGDQPRIAQRTIGPPDTFALEVNKSPLSPPPPTTAEFVVLSVGDGITRLRHGERVCFQVLPAQERRGGRCSVSSISELIDSQSVIH